MTAHYSLLGGSLIYTDKIIVGYVIIAFVHEIDVKEVISHWKCCYSELFVKVRNSMYCCYSSSEMAQYIYLLICSFLKYKLNI